MSHSEIHSPLEFREPKRDICVRPRQGSRDISEEREEPEHGEECSKRLSLHSQSLCGLVTCARPAQGQVKHTGHHQMDLAGYKTEEPKPKTK